ncbi:MAG TPA: prenyltransferase [Chloroflexi bacterium]|nr:prenyltransferase [Chloroflexota bacterium]
MKEIKFLLDPMRLPFLVLTPACVVLGLGTAIWTQGEINWFDFALVLIGALAAHISVNSFNEYFDFKSGLDAKTRRTPFSGGSGRLQKNPELEKPAYIMSWGFLALVGLIGIHFSIKVGPALIPLGLLGLSLIYFYTGWITRYPLLCLIAPGLGFGTLMVMGTDYVLTGSYSWPAFVASLIPFFLVSNLLLLNQFPDAEVDKRVGRKHYPIQIGKTRSSRIYLAFLILPFVVIGLGVVFDSLPLSGLLGMLGLILVVPIFRGVLTQVENTEELIPVLGQNVLVNIVTPILLAVGLVIGWPG